MSDKILFLDTSMGAAGDMLCAALFDLLTSAQQETYLQMMNTAGLQKFCVEAQPVSMDGISGIHMDVRIGNTSEEEMLEHLQDEDAGNSHHEHFHHHDGLHDHDHHHTDEHDHHHCFDCSNHTHPDHHDHEHHHSHSHDHDHAHHHHHHASYLDICRQIRSLPLPEAVQEKAAEVYEVIARAECAVHGEDMEHIHFHEVGTIDAVADITGFCLLMEMLNVDQVVCTPVCTGFGSVRCAHGILPVPAPATARILAGMPVYAGDIEGELCTPTGAALLKAFTGSFSQMPLMVPEKNGYGFGTRRFSRLNAVRAVLGHSFAEPEAPVHEEADLKDSVCVLSCTIDDMSGEDLGSAMENLLACGARDVFYTPVMMKKSRPAVLMTLLCLPEDQQKMQEAVFRYTTTIGIRSHLENRSVLTRKTETAVLKDPQGNSFEVRCKISKGYGASKAKIEYEDAAAWAALNGISVMEARRALEKAFEE